MSLKCIDALILVYVPKIRIVNICRMPIRSSILTIKGAPADHDTKICNFYHVDLDLDL